MNVLFDEVKLTQEMRFTGGHIIGHTKNDSSDILATHALLIELIDHFGGPQYILRVWPVANLNNDTFKDILLEAIQAIVSAIVGPLSNHL